ncbi:hypothetical protein DPMN_089592 [Dreissena polymorpha]|uniref:Uncharacterized protein n=1 Tax=Dreissena polymorpha TaxID=45954 RepID=A0A9D4QY87_DREPO|nr:hypothetical protein DPMN_089592 [Dreissena polymorpha]
MLTIISGDDCDKEYDWCAERPCSLGRNCTNVPQNGTYSYSPCPNGYAGEPGTNECIGNVYLSDMRKEKIF